MITKEDSKQEILIIFWDKNWKNEEKRNVHLYTHNLYYMCLIEIFLAVK